MIIAYLIMCAMIVLSILYLYYSVAVRSGKRIDANQQVFSNVRRAEITEEVEAGRLTSQESAQLLLDIEHESRLQPIKKSHFFHTDVELARWVMLAIVAVAVLGSVSLYQSMGYSKDVFFTQDLQNQQLTPQKISAFLQYRSRRYDRVEDWYYEATDFVSTGKYTEAIIAFEKALDRLPENAENRTTLLVEYAQTVFYANGNQSSEKMRRVVDQILKEVPTEAIALGLKGVSEFDQKHYLGAVLAWQEAIRYNPRSAERIALLSAIGKAREAGAINYEQVAPIITHQVAVKIEWEPNRLQWHSDDILLVYALVEGQKMPVAIQRVLPEELGQPILLTNLDSPMPTGTLVDLKKVDLMVKLSNINDNDLTKGRIIGIKESSLVNSKEIIVIKVAL
ncbi:hypothetical protein MUS1_12880 [Marinomonas ushuaiensis DSM 15871]|uniref:Uncharacterized protein n=1 Tax=Marinomonas ushuaiensis DSM 15871 TaxID=1122207 RepID=X7E6S3_9GAMM|nr:hypothetical protein [Marinomonas ushuaiensis]ETX10866.1 hypothetical protein MUS1_12880 [Marinomonas ushuaiensis DSM 15871]